MSDCLSKQALACKVIHLSKVLQFFLFARKFLINKNLAKKPSIRVLPVAEKMEFLKTSVSWIEGRDIMDTCFILNFGYEDPLPWPQV